MVTSTFWSSWNQVTRENGVHKLYTRKWGSLRQEIEKTIDQSIYS